MSEDRVLIDIDDTAGQFRLGYLDTVFNLHGVKIDLASCLSTWDIDNTLQLTQWQINAVWKAINSPGWNQQLLPMPGAVEAIDRLARKHEVMFVSKPLKSSATWESDRRKWVRKYFGVKLSNSLHQTGQKHAVDGNWFIEDKPEYAEAWTADRQKYSRRRSQAILYAWPYNESSTLLRLPNWRAIVDYIGA